jgi:hypothetical protein
MIAGCLDRIEPRFGVCGVCASVRRVCTQIMGGSRNLAHRQRFFESRSRFREQSSRGK